MERRRSDRERRRLVLVLGLVALAFSTFFYGGTITRLMQAYDPNAVLRGLEGDGVVRTLDRWEARLETCGAPVAGVAECTPAAGGPLLLASLPAVEILRAWKARTAPDATHAVFRYLPPPGGLAVPREWAHAAVVVPRSVHQRLSVRVGDRAAEAWGVGNDVVLHVPASSFDARSLSLRMEISGLPWFGPADFPVALVESSRAPQYVSLTQRILFAADLQSLIEVGLPVLFGAVALVLDHSPVFAGVALYGSARGARSWVTAQVSSGQWELGEASLLSFALANAACAVMLVGVAAWIAGFRKRLAVSLAGAFLCLGPVAFLYLRARQDALMSFDLRVDAVSACGAAMLLGVGVARDLRGRRPAVELVAGVLLLLGAAFHGWVNAEDLARLADGATRTPLDWRHSILFPFLAVATLVEVGSVGRSMRAFAAKEASTAVLEREVELARDMQRRTLPAMRRKAGPWEWRVYFKPIVALGGDWVDVRTLGSPAAGGGGLLVAAVVDVTGHGIGPALVTGTLCAQWGLWCRDVSAKRAAGPFDGGEALVALAESLHGALTAMGRGDTCTGLFLIVDPVSREIHYVTCGHPGFLVREASTGKVSYMQTRSSWLGSPKAPGWGASDPELGHETETAAPVPSEAAGMPAGMGTPADSGTFQRPHYEARTHRHDEGGTVLALYTDGLVPVGATVTSWLKDLRRRTQTSEGSFLSALVSQVRSNRKAFLKGHQEADDITLVLVRIEASRTSGARHAPPNDDVA